MSNETKLNRAATVKEIIDIFEKHTNNPADELIAMGKCMIEIGEALRDVDVREARAIVQAVQALS